MGVYQAGVRSKMRPNVEQIHRRKVLFSFLEVLSRLSRQQEAQSDLVHPDLHGRFDLQLRHARHTRKE